MVDHALPSVGKATLVAPEPVDYQQPADRIEETLRMEGILQRLLISVLALGSLAYAQGPAPLVASGNVENTASMTVGNSTRPLLDVPPLPRGKATVMGGTIQNVDHLRDRMVLQVFGGRKMALLFDERTHVYRGEQAASLDDLKNGERVYVDTMLDGTTVFARNVRVAGAPSGSSSGQIVSFDSANGELKLRDSVSPTPVNMKLAQDSVIVRNGQPAQKGDLKPGSLITAEFVPDMKGSAKIRKISILASPGMVFAFSGRVEFLDLRRGILVLIDPRDNKSYQVEFDPATQTVREIHEGSDVSVSASFDGRRYAAQTIIQNAAPSAQ